MLVELAGRDQIIFTETSYDETYRYRLWVAAVEDAAALGMGFRAYRSHVIQSLYLWANAGDKFRNAKGEPLNLDALTQDDMWGFLGRKTGNPAGPGRRIEPAKVAVLDAYFKRKSPNLSKSFSRSDYSAELAAILRTFFAGQQDDAEPTYKRAESYAGCYVKTYRMSVADFAGALKKGDRGIFSVDVLIVRPNEKRKYISVHKLKLPLLPKYVGDQELAERFRKQILHNAASATVIFSGVGLPIAAKQEHERSSLACLLRDRRTYDPHLMHLGMLRQKDEQKPGDTWRITPLEEDDEVESLPTLVIETFGGEHGGIYKYCGFLSNSDRDNVIVKRRWQYSEALENELIRIYKALGEEI